MEPRIIFEDEVLLVLNKPVGWVVDEAETTKNVKTIQGWLRLNFQFPIFNFQKMRNGIVHRLDKETSGILLIAKTPESFMELQRQFKERLVHKTYLALVHGKVEPEEGEINAPIGRTLWNRERFGITLDGKSALTHYRTVARYQKDGSDLSFLELSPQTGRTHQIRVHMQYRGYPLVSDEFYAGKKVAQSDRQWCPRIFLHAAKIEIRHPVSMQKMQFEAKLPVDLTTVIKNCDMI